jgi:AraC-like DNA-binding protein
MLPAASIDDFLAAPVGRFFAGESYIAWCWSPTLAGTCYFGKPRTEDLEALTRLSVLPRNPALHAPFDAIIDAGGLEEVGTEAFATFTGHIADVVADLPPVRRVGVVRPAGIVGAAIAGIYYDRGVEKMLDTALFSDPMEAFNWLGRKDALAAHDDVQATVVKVRGTPPMLRALRDWLATHLDHPQLEDAARALRSSTRTLQRSLLACSTSFRAEVERARVREAERLLTESDEKVEVIARRVGCASPSHFAALFRRTTGEAPADFRGRRRR